MATTATMEEIHEAYRKLEEFFHPDRNTDPDARIFFNDITLAYNTLSNPQSRTEYDDYMSTCYKYATMWMHLENEEEKERLRQIEERRRKRLERMRSQQQWQGSEGKHGLNEEFFSSWQSRTKRGGAQT